MAVWSSIHLSGLGHAYRAEAEYYRPTYLEAQRILDSAKAEAINPYISYLTDGTHITPKYVESGIPFLSSSDIDTFSLSFAASKFITEKEHGRLRHCQPQAGDILISKSGRIGSCAVVPDKIKKGDFNIYEGVALLRPRSIEANYLAAFLNSKYGQLQIRRELKGVAQPHLHLEDVRRLKIFLPSSNDINLISGLVNQGVKLLEVGNRVYRDAQRLLESELGLDKLMFETSVGYESSFSLVAESIRLDAQHYRPEQAALITHIKKGNWRYLRQLRTYNRRGVQPIYVEGGSIDVVNSQHIGRQHLDYDNFQKTSELNFHATPEAHISEDDLLIYTTGAYIGSTNIYLTDKPALASNHVNILRLDGSIDPAYMTMVMQSKIGQIQTAKHARGSAQAELYPSDIDKFVVPLVDEAIATKIGNLVRDSLRKQQESKQLLEQAKSRVEQLIEKAVTP